MYSEDYNDPFRNEPGHSHSPGRGQNGALATASLILAFASLLCSAMIYVCVPCAALSILFALLSRGNGRLTGKGKISIGVALAGAISSVIVTAGAFYMIMTDPGMKNQFVQLFTYYAREYGLDYDSEDLAELFGIDIDAEDPDAESENDEYREFWEEFFGDGANRDWEDRDQEDRNTNPIPDDSDIVTGGEFI